MVFIYNYIYSWRERKRNKSEHFEDFQTVY